MKLQNFIAVNMFIYCKNMELLKYMPQTKISKLNRCDLSMITTCLSAWTYGFLSNMNDSGEIVCVLLVAVSLLG